MKKNEAMIITGSSNEIGKRIASKNKDIVDILGLSRRGAGIKGIKDVKIDLMNSLKTKEIILEFIDGLKSNTKLTIIHTAGKVKNEFNNKKDNNYHTIDKNYDGIDDEVFNSGYNTLLNVLKPVISEFKGTPKVGRINALSNKKDFIPSCSKSMTLTNKMINAKLMELNNHREINYHKLWVSTVGTSNELKHRRFSKDKKYWLKPNFVADSLVSAINTGMNEVELFVPHPLYHKKFKGESNERMSERFWFEITGKNYQ